MPSPRRGGRIVLFQGLIKQAETPEEVAGVLAHEIGHIAERHPTAGTIRRMGVTTLLDMVTGDGGALMEALGQAGGFLLLQAYSRDDERAADRIAVEMLIRARIDTGGLADFFERLAKDDDGDGDGNETENLGRWLAYISTHPASEERQRAAEAASNHAASRPVMSGEDWRALKAICGGKPSKK